MYPPPQADVALTNQPHQIPTHGVRFGFHTVDSEIKHNSNPPPFSYEYILEEGKMPILAEFHPMHRKKLGMQRSNSHHSSHQKRVQPIPAIKRSGSLQKQERQALHFNIPVGYESTTEKLKRALSLSSGKNSTQPSRNPSSASRREPMPIASSQPSRNVSKSSRREPAPLSRRPSHSSQPTPPPESRVPSLILPTPTPSPEPFNSSLSSPQKSPMNFGLLPHHHHNDRFSWASYDEDDYDDFEFLRENGMGRLSPSPRPYVNVRRDKAFELLGLTNKGRGLPYTPPPSMASSSRPSAASSERDYWSRNNSRRPSKDHRHSMLSQFSSHGGPDAHHHRPVTPKTSPIRFLDEEETPRPLKQLTAPKQISKPEPPVFVQRITIPKPAPIIVPDFPSPPAFEIRSAPPSSVPRLESPLHAAEVKVLVLAEPRPLPVLIGKTSRFIEHLDANAKRLSLPLSKSPKIPRVVFADTRLMSDPDMIAPAPRRATSPLPAPLRATQTLKVPRVIVTEARALIGPDSRPASQRDLSSAGIRRSVSMRESTSGPWGAVLCTAQARPIVATGHARMIQSQE